MTTMRVVFLSCLLPLLPLLVGARAAPFPFESQLQRELTIGPSCMVEILPVLCNTHFYNPSPEEEARNMHRGNSLRCRGAECQPGNLMLQYCSNSTAESQLLRASVAQRPVGLLPAANNAYPECDRYIDKSKAMSLKPHCQRKLDCICGRCCSSVNVKPHPKDLLNLLLSVKHTSRICPSQLILLKLLKSKLPPLSVADNTRDWKIENVNRTPFVNTPLQSDEVVLDP
ncbi:uncharacterized protein LOC122249253 isoform X1 [Penaeus japonicus]|uniref:uncharacterized protein LOC122249253 isoform X1 n=1 Tax=Penaeus japonicus TaxID=27405 RepID=UPI001C70D6FF|nr:uncharacterized protein LOC122249253 isoform X1 [Penaeus japonicus]XP_042865902.1 uncharacterized protein LOC122249253 isoform X1 [Penaeus japonicus]